MSDNPHPAFAASKIVVTKLEAAEAHIKTAARLYFEGAHLVPVFTLANAAREVVATIGEKAKIETVHSALASSRGISTKELVSDLSGAAGFLKHADRKAADAMELKEEMVAVALQLACRDFCAIAQDVPIEAQIYDAWILALTIKRVSEAPLRLQPKLRTHLRMMPGLRTASLRDRKGLGLKLLNDKAVAVEKP
ncbi:hypothetical protein SAMN05519103_09204 [Rhizobiales bacterium GAS113]|nr:hypothetical protein SAMN05519103_09204 [Rhizobiales bacterium GAS113]